MSVIGWMSISADGRPFWLQQNEDGTKVVYLAPKSRCAPGAVVTIALADCVQGLYAPDGSLLATANDEDG